MTVEKEVMPLGEGHENRWTGTGVVIDKIVLDFSPPTGSCLGPPESYRR